MHKVLVILEAGKAYPSGIIRGLIYKDLFNKNDYKAQYLNRLPSFLITLMEKSGRILIIFPS